MAEANPFRKLLAERKVDTAKMLDAPRTPGVASSGKPENPFRAAIAARESGAPAPEAPGGAPKMSWGDVARGAGENLVPSYTQALKDAAHPVIHPVETVKGLFNVGTGILQKLIPGKQQNEQYADAVGQFFANRYGGMENLKRTVAKDPVGFVGDLATVATLGGAGALKGAAVVGKSAKAGSDAARKFGEMLRTAGRMTDPLRLTVRGASLLGRGTGKAGSEALGWLTGAGGDAVRTAARTGALGGYLGERFRGAMRGKIDLGEVVDEAKGALNVLRHERSLSYARDMDKVAKDTSILNFAGIDDAIARADEIGRFKAQNISPSTARVRAEVREVVDAWKQLDPAEYHTPLGMDALKQRLGDILDRQDLGTREYRAVHQVYKAVRGEISAQAPEYARIMRSYERASDLIRDIEKSLSLGKNTGVETSVRKLQGIMKDNVTSAFGKRADFARALEGAGAEGIFETMAGSTMSSALPRGMATLGGPGTIGGLSVTASPGFLAALPLTSPRLVGEAVHGGARAVGPVARGLDAVARQVPAGAGLAALQTGRAVQVSDENEARRRLGL